MCNTFNLLTESIPLRMHSWNMKIGSNMKSNPQVYDTRWHYIINATTFTGKANTGHCKSEMTCYQLILTTRFLFNIAFLWKKTCKNKSGSWPTFKNNDKSYPFLAHMKWSLGRICQTNKSQMCLQTLQLQLKTCTYRTSSAHPMQRLLSSVPT